MKTTGYKTHIKRLYYTGEDTAIRTIKYPLYLNKDKKNKIQPPEYILEAIKHDDIYLRGASNIIDYIKFKQENKKIYTLLDFWLDSLLIGIIFQPTTSKLVDLITTIKNGESALKPLFDNATSEIVKYFDKYTFIDEILTKEIFKTNGSRENKYKNFKKCLKEDFKKSQEADQYIEYIKEDFKKSQEADQYIEYILDHFYDKNSGTLFKHLNKEEQNKLWKEKFNIDKNAVDLSHKLTFFIFNELAFDNWQTIEIDETNILDIFNKILKKREKFLIKNNIINKQNYKKQKNYLNALNIFYTTLLGFDNNFSAFSNYFNKIIKLLKNKKIDEVIQKFKLVTKNLSNEEEKIIKQKLIWLSKKLEHLEDPKLPTINSWADYRTQLGGKLQSWFSNYIKRINEQDDQIKKIKENLKNIDGYLNDREKDIIKSEDEEKISRFTNYKKKITKPINRVHKYLGNEDDLKKDIQSYNLFIEELNKIRQVLNEIWQNFHESKEKEINDNATLKDFFELKLYKATNFYGYSQKQKLKKVLETPSILETGIDIIFNLLRFIDNQNIINYDLSLQEKENRKIKEALGFRRLLQSIYKKYLSQGLNTDKFRNLYKNIIQRYLPEDTKDKYLNSKQTKYTFYKSFFSSSTQSIIDIEFEEDKEKLKQETKYIIDTLKNQIENTSKIDLLSNSDLLLDWIETSKFVISRYFRWTDKEQIDISPIKADLLKIEKAKLYIEKTKVQNIIQKEDLIYIIMSFIFSELRGTATIFSKNKILVKYYVNPINSLSKFSLIACSPDIIYKSDKESLKNTKYFVNLKINTNLNYSYLKNLNCQYFYKFSKDGKFKSIKEKEINMPLFINSSKYHLQFLDKLIYKPKNWQNVKITLKDIALLTETLYDIKWNLLDKNNPIKFKKNTNTKRPVLYYVVPFQLKIEKGNAFKKINNELLKDPYSHVYLGADIGEYGIAWSIIKIDEKNISILDKGFIFDKQIRKIQDKFQEIKQKARKGLFLTASTELLKLRENAIGFLRNKLHDRLIEYKGKIVYESSISNFEVGVGKITKIYDTVKRPDVSNHQDAGTDIYKKEIKHIWGIKSYGTGKTPGWQVSASGTSYTCLKCGRSLYEFSDSSYWINLGEFKKGSKIYRFKSKDSETILYGYIEKDSKIDLSKEYKFKDIKKYIKAFTRPPLIGHNDNIPSTILNFVINKGIFSKQELKTIKQKRGNSSLFICPFENCHSVTDADIQASVNIALRGFLYQKWYTEANKNVPKSSSNDKKNSIKNKFDKIKKDKDLKKETSELLSKKTIIDNNKNILDLTKLVKY